MQKLVPRMFCNDPKKKDRQYNDPKKKDKRGQAVIYKTLP
jgi:hypothetical protein